MGNKKLIITVITSCLILTACANSDYDTENDSTSNESSINSDISNNENSLNEKDQSGNLVDSQETTNDTNQNSSSSGNETNEELLPENTQSQENISQEDRYTFDREQLSGDDNGHLPDNAVLPGSGSADVVVFSSDFEIESPSCWNSRPNGGLWNLAGCGGMINIGRGSSVTIAENEVSHSGNKALKLTFNVDEDYGGAEVKFPESNRIFTRYYDYYDSGFDFAYAMKVHRIRSFNEETQINNYDAVMLSWGQSLTISEFDMSGTNDMRHLSFNYNGGPIDWRATGSDFGFQRNRWYCVETEMKINTNGQSDGEVRIWVDGVMRSELRGINIRGSSPGKLNLVLFGGWYSNGAAGLNPQRTPAQSSVRYIDDISVSTERIGCQL